MGQSTWGILYFIEQKCQTCTSLLLSSSLVPRSTWTRSMLECLSENAPRTIIWYRSRRSDLPVNGSSRCAIQNRYTISADCVTMEFSEPMSEGRVDTYFRGFYWMML